MSHLVNNPDRVGDVTAEPFTAPPPDPEKCPSAVTANFAVSFSIDAARGGCMRMQTAAQSADPTEETSGHPWPINKKPPRITSGGKRKAVFWGVCRVKAVGQTVQGTPTGDFGLTGFGGASIRCQPMVGWKKTGTPSHERACIAVFSRSGRLVQALKNHSVARSISSSSPK